LIALKTDRWKLPDSDKREALATGLTDCLGSANPQLRDELAFEGLSTWMRGGQLSPETMQAIARTLISQLAGDAKDAAGFGKPFAALALSEVARADRIKPFLAAGERARLIETGAAYLAGLRDYRGFDTRDGWRHGVAHGADLLMQLSANPAIGRADLERMLGAIAAQVVPAGEHFYIYGEPERLSRPVLLIARRGVFDAAAWTAWINRFATPSPWVDWDSALQAQGGLARRHNLAAFLLVLYASLREGNDETARQTLLPAVTAALRRLP
jgi:hypothetical protein